MMIARMRRTWALVSIFALFPAPAFAAEKLRAALYEMRAEDALQPLAKKLTGEVLVELGRHPGLMIIGQNELELMFQQASVRAQIEECSGDEGCIAKLANAADVDKAIVVRLARWADGGYFATVSIVGPKSGALEKGDSCIVERNKDAPVQERALVDCIHRTASRLLGVGAELAGENSDPARVSTLPLDGWKMGVFTLDAYDQTTSGISESLTEQVSLELKKVEGLSVASWSDIQKLIDWNRIRAECTGESLDRCIHDIAGKLGIDYLVTGGVGKLDDIHILHLKLLDMRDPAKVRRVAESFRGPQSQLGQAVRFAVNKLLGIETAGKGRLTLQLSVEKSEVKMLSLDGAPLPAAQLVLDAVDSGKHALSLDVVDHYALYQDIYVENGVSTTVHLEPVAMPGEWYDQWWVYVAGGGVIAASITAAIVIFANDPGAGLRVRINPPMGLTDRPSSNGLRFAL